MPELNVTVTRLKPKNLGLHRFLDVKLIFEHVGWNTIQGQVLKRNWSAITILNKPVWQNYCFRGDYYLLEVPSHKGVNHDLFFADEPNTFIDDHGDCQDNETQAN